MDRYQEAANCYEKALAIDPKHVPDWTKEKTPPAETHEYKQAKGAAPKQSLHIREIAALRSQ